MSDGTYELTCLAQLEDELMRAARAHPRRRLRRFLGFFAALAIGVPVGYATARQLIGSDPEPVVVHGNDAIEVGYLDPATGKPILCPDGTLLTQKLKGAERDDPTRPGDLAQCDDGSIPEVYRLSIEKQLRIAENAPFGTNLEEIPGVKSFRVDEGYEAP